MLDKSVMEQVFTDYIEFPCQLSSPPSSECLFIQSSILHNIDIAYIVKRLTEKIITNTQAQMLANCEVPALLLSSRINYYLFVP
jgi:hypothetical protein